jgi:PBP1b-binding outer membrane lipoprotein LpoB
MKPLIKNISTVAAIIIFLSSCVKEKYPIDFTDNTERPIAQFLKGDSSAAKATLQSLALDFSSSFAEYDLADIGVDLRNSLGGDIKIDIVKDNSLLDAYNNANGTAFDPLPVSAGDLAAASYTVNNSKKMVKVRVKVKPSELVGNTYALAIKINAVSQGEISKLRKLYIAEVKVKNAYEADYQSDGVRTSYAGATVASGVTGTFPWSFVKTLSTIDNSTCLLETADGVDLMYITVNPGNTVTVSDGPLSGFLTSNDGACVYNPAAKTFTLNYKYFNSAGRLRKMTETLVRQ